MTGNPSQESIYLRKRKGFVRMAIQAGAGVRPSSFIRLILEDEIGMQRWYEGHAHVPNGIWSVQTWCLSTTRASRSC